jgi:hypothetical protein
MHAGQPKGKKDDLPRHHVDFKNEKFKNVDAGEDPHIYYDV